MQFGGEILLKYDLKFVQIWVSFYFTGWLKSKQAKKNCSNVYNNDDNLLQLRTHLLNLTTYEN